MHLSVFSHTASAWQQSNDAPALSAEEQKEKSAADKFLELLIKRPASGTALDRVFGYHVERGTLGALVEDLTTKAQASQGDESGRLWFLIGLLQLQRGEDANAVKALAKAQELLKDNAMVAFHHGQALILVGDTDHAAEAFEVAVTRKPPRADYLNVARELGRLYQRAGRVDDALRIWNTLEKDFPGDDSVRQRIASTLAEEGDLRGALARYEALAKSAKAENDRVSYALEVANLRSQLGGKQQATEELDAILGKLRPGSYLYDEARRRVERIFLSSGDYVGLTEYYQRWIKNHPDDLNVMLRLARTLSLQGRSAEAIEQFQAAIQRAPGDPSPRLALIDAYLADNRFADAAKQFEPLVASGETNPDYLVKYGQVLMSDTAVAEADRQKAAAAVWKRLVTAKPKDAAVHSQVADLLRGAKLSDEAIAEYREAIKLAPEEPQHKEYLGEYLHQLKRTDEALAVWRSLAEGSQRTRDNLVRLAEVLHQFQQPDEALKTMNEACELKPQVAHRLRYVEWLVDAKEFTKANDQLALARAEAESVEDRARVFAAAMKTYQAAGELPARIAEATSAAEATPSDGEKWRQLAVLHEANQAPSDALKAIEKAIQADANNIETLDVAARMAQDAGRLPEAINYRKRLVEIDRRFRTAHLQRLSTLYVSSGQNELAISTGKEMLAGAGGAVEAFKFYADMCGQLGMRDERLDTLRRCLRLNPRSQEALGWLADQLSADFKTDQAIELVWKILDGAEQIEKRREAVVKLTELYLRNNRLDQLISRLEFRGRELNDRRTTADLVATAYQQAGDLGLARETLETLLREGGRDTVLIERMVALCEQAGEFDRAIELQRELMRINPNKQTQARLASLLIDVGGVEEAQSLWLSTVDIRSDAFELGQQVERLFSRGEQRAALSLCTKVLEANPQDWEMAARRMVLHAEAGNWTEADKDAQTLLSLNVSDDTLSTQAQKMQARNNRPQQVAGRSYPKRLQRVQNLYELYYLVDSRYSNSQPPKLPTLMDAGHAKVMARYVHAKQLSEQAPEQLEQQVNEARSVAMKPDATVDQAWDWFTQKSVTENVMQRSGYDVRNPDAWDDVWRLTEVDQEAGSYQLINMISSRTNMLERNSQKPKPLSDKRLEQLKKLVVDISQKNASQFSGSRYALPVLVASELRLAGKEDEAKSFVEQLKPGASSTPADLGSVSILSSFGKDDELWPAVAAVLDPKNKTKIQQQYGSFAVIQIANMFINAERIKKDLSLGPEDPVYRQRCFQLLDAVVKNLADSRTNRSQLRLSSLGGERRNYIVVNGMAQQIDLSFPPAGLGPDDQSLMFFRTAEQQLKEYIDQWVQNLADNPSDMEPRLQVQRLMTAAIVRHWQDRTDDALAILQRAVEIASKEVSHEEAPLRLMQADLLLRQDRKQDALGAIEGITVYDQSAMAVREYAAARLAVALGDKDRARQAARRLYGVRLETDTQIALAKLMHSLEMPELANDLVRRMRSRSGGSTQQLQTLMNYFKTQNENDQAAQVAMELLQRSAPMRSKNNSVSSDQAGRASALQVLSAAGRLKDLITNTEKRLERAPKSQRIQTELVEMYVAAGQNDKVQKLLDTDGKDGKPTTESTAALEAMAKQLAGAGKTKELCDVYLKLLKRKPQYMDNGYYEVIQAFQQSQRMDELIDLVIETGTQKFQIYRICELCGEALRQDRNNPKARKLLLAIFDRKDLRAGNIRQLGYLIMNIDLKDQEIYDRIVGIYLDTSSQINGDWSNLFDSYSTQQDGRTSNGLTLLVDQVAPSSEQLQRLEKQVRERLEKNNDWFEGKAWLGLILTAGKRFDEALKQLEPLIANDFRPSPSQEACWLIGSFIDKHEAMRPLAARMYDFGMSQDTSRINNGFQYSIVGRAVRLAAEMGDKEKGRQLLRRQLEESKKNPQRVNYGNAQYEAYMRITNATSTIELFTQLEAYADALKVARELDRADFAKSSNYGGNSEQQFDERIEKLMTEVRKQGGFGALMAMIDSESKHGPAVDFGVSVSDTPFTGVGLQSIWLDLLTDLQTKPEAAANIEELSKLLAKLKGERPDDLSVKIAHAIVTSQGPTTSELTELLASPPEPAKAAGPAKSANQATQAQPANPAVPRPIRPGQSAPASSDRANPTKTYSEQMACLILRWNQLRLAESPTADASPVIEWLGQHTKQWTPGVKAGLVASLGQQLLKQKNTAPAIQLWKSFPDSDSATSIQLIDLAIASVNNDIVDLAVTCARKATSVKSADSATAVAASAGSLGQLLGAASSPRQAVISDPFGDQADNSRDTQLASLLLQLDKLWTDKKLDPQQALEWQSAWIMPEGKAPNPLVITARNLAQQDLANIRSLFDNFARRASENKQTEVMVAKLKPKASGDKAPVASDLGKLLSAHLWLRDKQVAKAVEELKAIDLAAIDGLPLLQCIQTLLAALDQSESRPVAASILLHIVEQHKPTERYEEVEPYLSMALKVAQAAIDHDLDTKLRDTAIIAYTELSTHNNQRYSGSYGVRNLIQQNEAIARPFLMKGKVPEALKYLGQREPAYNLGFDEDNDWVGTWALESLQGSQDHAQSYRTLVDWTFSGDGALHSIVALSRRAPLPKWIPASVGGNYPTFGPTADPLVPLASNFYSLARLAEETGNTADLLQRFEEAYKQGRAGADTGLAIALVALKQAVPEELTGAIAQRVTSLKRPEPNSETQVRAPLAELQLALLLANDAKYGAWSQQIINHTNVNARRPHLAPWLDRYQFQRGWTEAAKLKPVGELPHWLATTNGNSHSFYEGDVPAMWLTDGQSKLENVGGFAQSDLWLRYPLEGDFSFELEVDRNETVRPSLSIAGMNFLVTTYNTKDHYGEIQSEAFAEYFRSSLEKIADDQPIRISAVVAAGTLKFKVNEEEVYSQPTPEGPLWVGIQANQSSSASSNIKLSGQPKIARQVTLIGTDSLRHWSGVYYGQSLPATPMVEPKKKGEDNDMHYFSAGLSATRIKELSWTTKDGELISGESSSSGPGNQSVIQLTRPLGTGEKLEYEFYYEPGKFEVHPTLGRTAFMLRPDGLHQHWMTENNTSWSTPNDYEVKIEGAVPLPLKSGAWNKVIVETSADRLKLILNDQTIFDQPWDYSTPGANFGLFHYRDKTQVRVRNAQLSGPWPEQLPASLFAP